MLLSLLLLLLLVVVVCVAVRFSRGAQRTVPCSAVVVVAIVVVAVVSRRMRLLLSRLTLRGVAWRVLDGTYHDEARERADGGEHASKPECSLLVFAFFCRLSSVHANLCRNTYQRGDILRRYRNDLDLAIFL